MTWKVLRLLLDEEVMPNIKKYFIREGSFGFLKSVIPPITSPAWTSIFTGVNPGKHGVFNFFKLKFDYSTEMISSYDVKFPRIYQMLTQLGYRSIVINIPHSVPFFMLNGFGIGDWLSGELHTYPTHLVEEIDYTTPIPPKSLFKDNLKGVTELKEQLELRIDTIKKLLNKYSWDGIFIVFSEPDFLFHGLLDKIIYRKDERLLELVYDIFSEIDKVIGMIINKNENGVTAIVSDHGFTTCYKSIDLASILSKINVINYKKAYIDKRLDAFNIQACQRGFIRSIKVPALVYDIISNIKNKPLFSQLYNISVSILKHMLGSLPVAEYGKSVDYCNSLVIPHTPNGVALLIYINTLNRFLCGFLKHEDTKKLQKFLLYYLKNLRDNKGNKLFQIVDVSENIYYGPYVNEAPSVIAIPNLDKGYCISMHSSNRKIFTHDLKGIALFYGNNINRGHYFGTISVYDVVPTLLYLAKLPIPKFTDGKIIYSIMESKSNKMLVKDYWSKYKLALRIHRLRTYGKWS